MAIRLTQDKWKEKVDKLRIVQHVKTKEKKKKFVENRKKSLRSRSLAKRIYSDNCKDREAKRYRSRDRIKRLTNSAIK